jgi:outer membrane PBP1 activator LpoA protein
MMSAPYPNTAQFMSGTAGLGRVGKKAKIQRKIRNKTAMMLMGNPNLPRLNFDGSSGSPRILFNITQPIDIRYDVYIAAAPREMTCIKATLEPRLINDSRRTNMIVTYTELSGTPSVGDT